MYPLLRRSSLESSKTINHADCLSCAAGSWILQSNKSRPVSRPVRADFPARTSFGFRTECNITHRLLRSSAFTEGLLRAARRNRPQGAVCCTESQWGCCAEIQQPCRSAQSCPGSLQGAAVYTAGTRLGVARSLLEDSLLKRRAKFPNHQIEAQRANVWAFAT